MDPGDRNCTRFFHTCAALKAAAAATAMFVLCVCVCVCVCVRNEIKINVHTIFHNIHKPGSTPGMLGGGKSRSVDDVVIIDVAVFFFQQ